MIETPHYHLVPKEIDANLRWRQDVLSRAAQDDVFAAAIRQMCSEDIMFYINGFCWTFDPRSTTQPNKPFITYDYQDEVILGALDSIMRGEDRVRDEAWPKSRATGASWMGCVLFEWLWHFIPSIKLLMVSRVENYVDQVGNAKSLFWKIDYMHRFQPNWLLPNGRWLGWKDPGRRLLHLENNENGAVIDGESTTGDVARGDRRAALFIDEFAAFDVAAGFAVLKSTAAATNCRIFNSTPQGSNNAFFEVVDKTGAVVRRMHWSRHPMYARGLYEITDDHKVVLKDNWTGMVSTMRKGWKEPKDVIYPEQYPFETDKKPGLRSPWYDNQCARCVSQQEIGQELDIDFLGSDYQFFDPLFIREMIREYASDPLLSVNLLFNKETAQPEGLLVAKKDEGLLRLWVNFAGSGDILKDRTSLEGRRFGVGADVSQGTGASNSAASVVDLDTGEKVAVWSDSNTDPKDFATICVALCRWFNDAVLIWDASGPTGRSFTKQALNVWKYGNLYYRKSEEKRRKRMSDKPGYFLNPEDRAILLRDYRESLSDRKFINRSITGLNECLQFIVHPGGTVEHSASMNSQDPSGAREAHGDEAIADALASRLVFFKKHNLKAKPAKLPEYCMANRLKEYEHAQALAAREDW